MVRLYIETYKTLVHVPAAVHPCCAQRTVATIKNYEPLPKCDFWALSTFDYLELHAEKAQGNNFCSMAMKQSVYAGNKRQCSGKERFSVGKSSFEISEF